MPIQAGGVVRRRSVSTTREPWYLRARITGGASGGRAVSSESLIARHLEARTGGWAEFMKAMTARTPALVLLLMTFFVSSARGACLNWVQTVGNSHSRLTYVGMLGNHPIRMMLHLDVATGHFDGAYGYNDQPGMLALTGSMRSGGVEVDLDERDKQGLVTGHFSLRFFEPRAAGEDPAIYKKYPTKCSALTGSWRSSSKNEMRDVGLHADGMTDPADDQERELNEATAYKLRQAMLNNNKHAFASLLKYPFYTNGFYRTGGALHLVNKTYRSPEEVINYYDGIIHFSYKEIRDAVPHVLDTYPGGSNFMSRSVDLTDGRVTRICAGACPIDP